MEAFPVTVAFLPIQLIDSSSRRITGTARQNRGYVLRCVRQKHRQSNNFYQYRSCVIQQAGGNIDEEKLECALLAKLAYVKPL